MNNKSVYIKTFGCQMNIRDSEFAMGIMLDSGFGKADSMERADVILFNSCSVRKHAEDRLFSNIADLKDLKKKRPGMVIGLIGCTAQNYQHAILTKVPIVDFVCGPGNIEDLPGIVSKTLKSRCRIIAADKVDKKRQELFPKYRNGNFKAYVSISEGCDNFCSYCVVPYVRGRERSRREEDIIKEVKDLANRGFKEITLLGQNVNSYKKDTRDKTRVTGFVKLLERLNAVNGIERIRFMTSHPKDAGLALFKAMRDLDKVCEHLHLPLQSGSTRMLRLMNRRYTHDKYLKLVEGYRKIVPGGSISTDIIVGFPSEGAGDFKKTYEVMKKTGFDSAFLFKYSPRTPARSAGLKDDVSRDIKEDRLKRLLDLQCEISEKRNEEMKGRIVEILVDGFGKKDPSLLTPTPSRCAGLVWGLTGRTRTNKVAVFKGAKNTIGKFVNIKVESVTPYALKGRVV